MDLSLFDQARANLAAVLRDMQRGIARLPVYDMYHRDSKGEPCGWETDVDGQPTLTVDNVKVITVGLEQWCSYDPEDNRAFTDGWDDLGDITGPEFISCLLCDRDFRVPEDLEWN